jgi:hypothetical protein
MPVIQLVETPAVGSPSDDDCHNCDCRQQPDHAIAAVDEDRYRYAMKPTLNKDHDPSVTLKVRLVNRAPERARLPLCDVVEILPGPKAEQRCELAHLTPANLIPAISFTLSAARQLSKAIVRAANGAQASLSKSKHSAPSIQDRQPFSSNCILKYEGISGAVVSFAAL